MNDRKCSKCVFTLSAIGMHECRKARQWVTDLFFLVAKWPQCHQWPPSWLKMTLPSFLLGCDGWDANEQQDKTFQRFHKQASKPHRYQQDKTFQRFHIRFDPILDKVTNNRRTKTSWKRNHKTMKITMKIAMKIMIDAFIIIVISILCPRCL